MISTIINVGVAGVLSVLAYYVNNLWTFLVFGWIILLLATLSLISILIAGIRFLIKGKWLFASINFVMLIPLIYFSLPMLILIGG